MGWAGLTAVLMLIALPVVASAQGVPLPTPAPKKPVAAGRPSAAPGVDVRNLPARPVEPSPYDDSKRPLVDRVNTYLSSVQTMVGDFVQVGPDGARTFGKFFLAKPGRVRFEYEAPSPIDIVADGQSVAVRDRKLATQDVYPLSQTPLRLLLADQIDLLRETNVISVAQDRTYLAILLEERQFLVGTHRLLLMFNAKDMQLRQWTVTDPQGYDTTVAIYNVDTARRPDLEMFKISSGWGQ